MEDKDKGEVTKQETLQTKVIDGWYKCDTGITVDEWKELLMDKSITSDNILKYLIMFYLQPYHTSTCKNMSEIYNIPYSSFVGSITTYAMAIQKKLNRFIIKGIDQSETYYTIIMNGRYAKKGLFQWQIKDELVQAMEELNLLNDKFTWIPFYMEFAIKLLKYKEDRASLLSFIYNEIDSDFTDYLLEKDGEKSLDICPFTTMGIFNRQMKRESRIRIAELFKDFLGITAALPQDFIGIPVLNNQKSWFFVFQNDRGIDDIENLWNLFEKVVKEPLKIKNIYNTVIQQKVIKINITMGLYWINPFRFLSLDGVNRDFLENKYNIFVSNKKHSYEEYIELLDEIEDKIKSGIIKESTFPRLSAIANGWEIEDENSDDIDKKNDSYNLKSYSSDLEPYYSLLMTNKNIVFTGPPGTGKTFLSKKLANSIAGSEDRVSFVQFHPSYDYTDFVEGLRPYQKEGMKEIGFRLEAGIFKSFCQKAKDDLKNDYVFIIDEINRGEISKIFGELFFSIDPGYRGEKGKVRTQYSNLHSIEQGTVFDKNSSDDCFYIPENVYIIGTMNDIDRSVDSMDFAMRRRFTWIEITAKESEKILDGKPYAKEAKSKMQSINNIIGNEIESLNSSYHIGAAYFLKLDTYKDDEQTMWQRLWSYHLEPLIREYLRGMTEAEEYLKKIEKAYQNTATTDADQEDTDKG